MGEKLGGSASNPMTMIMGGGGAAGGPAGLAQPTPFIPYSTGPGLQRGFSPGGQQNPYGIVTPDQARPMAREQQGGKGKGPPGLEGLLGGGGPGGMLGSILGGGGPGGMPGGMSKPDPMKTLVGNPGRDPLGAMLFGPKAKGVTDGSGSGKK